MPHRQKRDIEWGMIFAKGGMIFAAACIVFFVLALIFHEDPPAKPVDHVEQGGPHSEEMLEYARELDIGGYDADWELALVVEDFGSEQGVRVKTGMGTVLLFSDCFLSDDRVPSNYISTMVNEGDLIMYDTTGDDHNICGKQVAVVGEK